MYRNLVTYTRANVQYVWESTWNDEGKRIEIETPIEPYLYYEDPTADDTYKSLYGKSLRKMTFQTEYERKEWIKRSPNIPLFEKMPIIRQYLIDKYIGQEHTMEFSKYPFRIFNIDIEIEVNGEFPDPYKANYPINVISIYNTLENQVIAWCYKSDAKELMTNEINNNIIQDIKNKYDNSPRFQIKSFNNEIEMLHDFINYWIDFYPDIVTRMEY